jgi:hypothetical protein
MEKLKNRLKDLPNEVLFEMLYQKNQYTPLALQLAKEELKYRTLTAEEKVLFDTLSSESIVKEQVIQPSLNTKERLTQFLLPWLAAIPKNVYHEAEAKQFRKLGIRTYGLAATVTLAAYSSDMNWLFLGIPLILLGSFFLVNIVE